MSGCSGTIAAVAKVHCLCKFLFSYGSEETTRKCLMDGHENINKISCFVVQKCSIEC